MALSVAIFLILKKVPPAYGMIAGALIGGLIGGADLAATVKLMIEGAQAADAPICAVTQDYSDMMLPVVMPSEAECAAHAAMLEVIDKASSGKTLWKLAVAPDDPA